MLQEDMNQEVLGCSRDVAANRVVAAYLARKYPVVLTMLRERQLHVSGIRVIAQHLDDDTYEARLKEACGKTREELQELVATWAPKPDVATRVVAVKQAPVPELLLRMQEPSTAAPVAAPVEPQRPAPLPKPLSPKRYKIEITVDAEVYAALMRQRNNLRHSIPDGDIAKVVSRAVLKQDARDEARKFGKRTRPAKPPQKETELPLQLSRDSSKAPDVIIQEDIVMNRTPDRATRRAVAERDGYRCCYVAEDGRRCSAMAWLEYDHKVAWSLNGPTTTDNLQLLCKSHNRAKAPTCPGVSPA